MKKLLFWQIGAVALAVVAIPVLRVALFTSNRPAANAASTAELPAADEPPPVHATRVEVVKPKPGGMERATTQPGTVHAFEYEEMFAKVSGYLKDQAVDIGTRVKKGQVLAAIDAPELEKEVQQAAAALDQARAQVKQAEAHVAAARAELTAAEKLVAQRQAEVQRTKSVLNYRRKQYERYKALAELKSVDLKLVDEQFEYYESAVSGHDAAKAAVDTARADVAAKQAKVEQAAADLIAAQANVGVAKAHLDKANVFLGFTKIVSHYDGVVTQRNYHNGDFIRQADKGGLVPLFVVQRTDRMRVIVKVPDDDVPFADAGDPADLEISSLPNAKFAGYKVSRVSYTEDEKSRTMRVEIDVPNPDGVLRDGMFGYVTIHLNKASPKAFTVPSACLVHSTERRGQTVVYVVRDGVARRVPVRAGQDNGREVEILSGLKADDLVVREHYGPIGDGTPVEAEADHAAHQADGH